MLHLADVELQSIMHYLNARDLLSLAVCNHRLLHAADSTFAWSHLPLRMPDSRLVYFPSTLPFGLQSRHRPSSIHFSSRGYEDSRMASSAWFDVYRILQCAGNLCRFDLSYKDGFGFRDICRPMLEHPAMQQLRELRMGRAGWKQMELAMLKLIVALPRLHTFYVAPDTKYPFFIVSKGKGREGQVDWKSKDPDAMWSLLPTSPSLTSLHIAACSKYRIDNILKCTKLIELRLHAPTLTREFFFSPNMIHLQSLTLELFTAGVLSSSRNPAATQSSSSSSSSSSVTLIPTLDFDRVFSTLRELRILHLRCVDGVNAMIPSIRYSSSLRQLFICPGCKLEDVERFNLMPSPHHIGQLLMTSVDLTCTLQFAPLKVHRLAPPCIRSFVATAIVDRPSILDRLLVTHSDD